jgi:hypothetical protein
MQKIFDDINDEFIEMSAELTLLKAYFTVHKKLKEVGKLPH